MKGQEAVSTSFEVGNFFWVRVFKYWQGLIKNKGYGSSILGDALVPPRQGILPWGSLPLHLLCFRCDSIRFPPRFPPASPHPQSHPPWRCPHCSPHTHAAGGEPCMAESPPPPPSPCPPARHLILQWAPHSTAASQHPHCHINSFNLYSEPFSGNKSAVLLQFLCFSTNFDIRTVQWLVFSVPHAVG